MKNASLLHIKPIDTALRDDERLHLRESLLSYMGKKPIVSEPVFAPPRSYGGARLLVICAALVIAATGILLYRVL